MKEKRIEAEQSSGNVFEDLGLPDPEERLAKADLAIRIADLIQDRGMTQAQAAEALGLKQPHVSNLIRGRLDGFSIERLFRLLNRLGQDVRIVVADKPSGHPIAHTFVDHIPTMT
jgi:predicted XRE-type DNA-binding protein